MIFNSTIKMIFGLVLLIGAWNGRVTVGAPVPLYSITVIPTLGGTKGSGNAINRYGTVTGAAWLPGDIAYHAFTYHNGTVIDLGTLPAHENSTSGGINDLGQVVGFSWPSSGVTTGFLNSNGAMSDVPGFSSTISGINNLGSFTGRVYRNSRGEAFVYESGQIVEYATLGGSHATGVAINDLGDVAGGSKLAGSEEYHAFFLTGGVVHDLGTLGGAASYARGLNDAGAVVGYSSPGPSSNQHAFLYDNGSMKDLGTLGGAHSEAHAINNSAMIVGTSFVGADWGTAHAFLFVDGTMYDLNELVPASKNLLTLLEANGINDSGQIAGLARLSNGGLRAVLLTPRIYLSSAVRQANGDFGLTGRAFANRPIALQSSASLATGFATVAEVVADGEGFFEWEDAKVSAGGPQFYRAILPDRVPTLREGSGSMTRATE